MNRAWIGIREQPHYRRDAFAAGLRACGYDVRFGVPDDILPGDVVCGWNRYMLWHDIATRAEAAGALYLCAENGYLGPGGVSPHQMEPREWYALALGGHNGSGACPSGDSSRWDALGVDLKPWRTDGEHILVCPNRSFGRPDLIIPLRWADDVKARLERVTKRPVRIRPHPGNGKQQRPLADDLAGAWACMIWSSSAGVQALIRGVPVVCEAPAWICRQAAILTKAPDDESMLESFPRFGDNVARRAALRALAWAQWHVGELATGEPFARLIEHAANREAIAA